MSSFHNKEIFAFRLDIRYTDKQTSYMMHVISINGQSQSLLE
jgi:hypothetical protein